MATSPTPSGAGGGAPNPSKTGIPAKPATVPVRPATAPAGVPPRGASGVRPPVGPPAKPASTTAPAKSPAAPPRPQSATPGARVPAGSPAKPASTALPAKPASATAPVKPAGTPASGGVPNIPRNSGVRAVPPIAQAPRQNSTRLPVGGTPNAAANAGVQSDRAKLGLGSLKPSEMIEGLDEVAKRLEKQEARESAKQKSGGKMSQNEALLTDGTGRRWQRNVMIGLILVVVLGALGFMAMMVSANLTTIDPRKGNATTRGMMMKLVGFAQRITVDEFDNLSKDGVVELLREQVETQYKQVEADIARDKDRREREGKHRPPDSRLYRELEELTELRKFKDPWGQPLEFEYSSGTLTIRGKGSPKGDAIEPVSTQLGKAAEKPAAKK